MELGLAKLTSFRMEQLGRVKIAGALPTVGSARVACATAETKSSVTQLGIERVS